MLTPEYLITPQKIKPKKQTSIPAPTFLTSLPNTNTTSCDTTRNNWAKWLRKPICHQHTLT